MPELPEVESTRRSLQTPLVGQRIVRMRLGKPLRWPLGVEPSTLNGLRVQSLQRRGKYLWFALANGEQPAGGLLWHLGMSGSLVWWPGDQEDRSPDPAGPHDHVDLVTDGGVLRMTDPRRFGAVVWSRSLQDLPASKLLASLGPEPFDETLTPASFLAVFKRRRVSVKAVLLSGEAMVGAGNIYACEALFNAGINPRLRAHRLSLPRATKLLESLRRTLAQAIDAGGTTLRDYRDAQGHAGSYQHAVRVYGREGEWCVTCGTSIRRIVQQQRSTFFCPLCQAR
jgi:formamidopyrimidine-DNA glycosylase